MKIMLNWQKHMDFTQFLIRKYSSSRVHWIEKLASNSLNLNPVNHSVLTALQQMVYHHKISDIDQLKYVLIDCWTQLSQDMLNWAIDQQQKKIGGYQGKGAHTEFGVD